MLAPAALAFAQRSRASTRNALKDTTYYVHIINDDVGGKLDEGSANWRVQDQWDTHARTELRRGHSCSHPAGAGLFRQQYLYRRHGCARLSLHHLFLRVDFLYRDALPGL